MGTSSGTVPARTCAIGGRYAAHPHSPERSREEPSGAERRRGRRGRACPLSPGRRDAADVPRAAIGWRREEGARRFAPPLYKRPGRGAAGQNERAAGRGVGVMPGLWERLAGGERGSLESSDCESLGSASGSEGGELGLESAVGCGCALRLGGR